ncbi:MAG TPA: PadR family transcriptional regulator [Spirochaetia bacterium]|nr:PadR family transcriptional regulator [Spirochaetia bacterium]
MAKTHGRHTPAFLLLLLADGPSYGALLLSRLQTELPFCLSDSAIVYRSLKQMEEQGLVETRWVPEDSGAPRKWYTLSRRGSAALAEHAEDIRRRQANLQFFLDRYKELEPSI